MAWMDEVQMHVIRVEIAKLTLKPGDRLVVRVPSGMMKDDELAVLRHYLHEFCGPDIPGIILIGDDLTLTTIEPAEKLF